MGGKLMKAYCSIPFNKELWAEFNNEMDSSGQIMLDKEDATVQIMPIDEYHFTSATTQVIEIVLQYSSQIALGLLINWLYDKLKARKVSYIKVNDHPCDLNKENAIENIIGKEADEEQ